ncbi:MAG: lipid A export permease/ATP-binding protein MsbA [Gammaproteobacteria bacterium]|nr:lipid A export permease/ATP-binding protein MsbA [Gammaproteobacteria bacterium]
MSIAPSSSRRLYLRLLTYARPYWAYFIASILGLVLVAVTEPAVPALFKPLLDDAFVAKDASAVVWIPFAIVGIFILRGIGSFVGETAMAWISGRLILDIREQIFHRLMRLPTSFFDHNSAGVLISKMTYDVSQVATAATKVLTVLIRDSLTILALLLWMGYISFKLTFVVAFVAPLIVYVVIVINKRLRVLSRSLQGSFGDMTHIMEEVTNGHKVVKIFGGQEYERRRFERAANWVRRLRFKAQVVSGLSVPTVQIIAAIGMAFVVYVAGRDVQAGVLTVGDFVSFFTAMALLFSPIKRLTAVSKPLQTGLAAAESAFGLIDQPTERVEGNPGRKRVRGAISFENVSFTYAGKPERAIADFNLEVKPGETLALVGPSGSGKSTLVSLIPRFYEVDAGRILLDGRDIAEVNLEVLRARITLVSQEPVLFNDTVRANIAYGHNAGASEEAILKAAADAHALEFIEDLPEGLDTNIGDRGVRLSGGQRQRLVIARAFLKDAPIVILDEATSALDSDSEKKIQAAFETLRRGRTTLVIAHRLSTIESADRIVVIRQGRIVEQGRHRDLLAAGGLYADLYHLQFGSAMD